MNRVITIALPMVDDSGFVRLVVGEEKPDKSGDYGSVNNGRYQL